MTLMTPELRASVGRELTFEAPDHLAASSFRLFALALGDDNPRWRAGEAPPTFLVESLAYLDDRDALLRGGEIWGFVVPGTRALRGGHEYELRRPVRVGDRITVTWRIADIEEKVSRSGVELLVLTSEATFRSGDEVLAINRETVIYQALA